MTVPRNKLRLGDFVERSDLRGWIWEFVSHHNNPNVGNFRLRFILPGAQEWYRPYDTPKCGHLSEFSFDGMDIHLTELEVLALVAN